jgi:hypothetical protein
MAETNPLNLFHTLQATLERYIPTTLPISLRYPELRRRFQEEVRRPRVRQLALPKTPKKRVN